MLLITVLVTDTSYGSFRNVIYGTHTLWQKISKIRAGIAPKRRNNFHTVLHLVAYFQLVTSNTLYLVTTSGTCVGT